MPRYKPPKITHREAADILNHAYSDGYARGLTGEPPAGPDPTWSEWGKLTGEQVQRGQNDGYAEFRRRVCAVKCGELPPPVVTFRPGYIDGKAAD